MDLSKRVVYDAEFPVTILNAADSDTGAPVVFYVKSMNARDIQKIERVGRNKLIAGKQARGDVGLVDTDLDTVENIEREKLIAAITRWEWNGNGFGDLGVDPEFTPENVAAVVDHANAGWIVDKLYMGAGNVANFTQK